MMRKVIGVMPLYDKRKEMLLDTAGLSGNVGSRKCDTYVTSFNK